MPPPAVRESYIDGSFMSTSNGVPLATGAADRLRQRLDDPATAAALNEILDRLDVIALSVNSLDGLLRRSDVIIENARDSVNDLRESSPKNLDLEKTLTQLGQSLPGVLDSLPELSRSLPQLTRLAARLNEPETSAAIDTVLDNAAVLALAAQSADSLLKRSDVIIENVAGSVRDVVGSDSVANVATFEQSLQMLAQLRDALPTLVQILPRLTRTLPRLLDVTEQLEVILNSPEFGALMGSGVFAPKTVGIVGEAGKAVVEVYDEQMAKATPAGRMDLFRALGDSDVQRALGFMIEFARRFGKHFR